MNSLPGLVLGDREHQPGLDVRAVLDGVRRLLGKGAVMDGLVIVLLGRARAVPASSAALLESSSHFAAIEIVKLVRHPRSSCCGRRRVVRILPGGGGGRRCSPDVGIGVVLHRLIRFSRTLGSSTVSLLPSSTS